MSNLETRHIEKVRELVEQYSESLLDEASHLIGSGSVDLEDYSADSYLLSKLLLTAAIHRTMDDYSPGFLARECAKTIRNLIRA